MVVVFRKSDPPRFFFFAVASALAQAATRISSCGARVHCQHHIRTLELLTIIIFISICRHTHTSLWDVIKSLYVEIYNFQNLEILKKLVPKVPLWYVAQSYTYRVRTPNVTPDIRSTVSQECTCSSPRPPSPLTRRRRRHLSRRCRPPSTHSCSAHWINHFTFSLVWQES